MTQETETIIIGGGLIGAFTAYFLAREGHPVTVLEKGFVGAQSSGANFGNLRLQGRDPRQYPLSLRAQAIWEAFETIAGESFEYDRTGHLYIARNEKELAKLEHHAEIARQHGLDIEMLATAALTQRFPYLATDTLAATFCGRDATANPRLATPVVMRAALRLGARIVEHCEALSTVYTGSRFEVETAQGRFMSKTLVNAAGAWGGAIAAHFGEPVPVFSAGPPQFVTEPFPHVIRPSMQMVNGSVIFRQIPRGNVIVAGYPRTASEADGNRTFVPPGKTLAGMEALGAIVPLLRDAHVIRVWSGVEGYLPDMRPVIGPSRTQDGLFHAFACCGHGFQIAPGIGAVLGELIRTGQTNTPIDAYDIARFRDQVPDSEKFIQEFDNRAIIPAAR
ncbi:NAD(P)/FAD-dependent oxidoreductase [Nitratireductor indicus]|uniref:FAD dependent oxidoreductase n=1 Tax=Nitratireductor indicus C115 TaxID=1231190 RepID=K2P7E6_9HYPH|nr:FAD-binding oxidoreductase [Nitratireductor indicus]EKF43146.1 FAD dependent oxidoreductase [Nitratireductor indicus C115]MDS1137701.1 FAD-binding oxidoreductase [Nitratireductor indicus]SFQ53136.1 sarcosine oxidase subunit beta [Nitratireductor indicus]